MENKNAGTVGRFNKKLFTDHLLMTFMIVILCWGACIILGINGLSRENNAWINIPYIMGGFSTTIASYIALKKNNEIHGFKDWLKHVFDVKHGIGAYIPAIAFPIIHMALICFIDGYEKGSPIYMLLLMVPLMIIGGGLEEAGWRYITFPELNKKFGFILSAALTSAIWWMWHLPLFFIPGATQYQKNFFIFGLLVLGLGFMLAAVRKVTGSVWLCVLCHSIVNALPEVFRYDSLKSASTNAMTAAVIIIISLIVIRIAETKNIFK